MPRLGTAHQRGYDHAHRKRRAELIRDMRDGDPCARCGRPMYRHQAPHLDADHHGAPLAIAPGTLPDALSHRSCNRAHGARLREALRGRAPRPRTHTPRRDLAPRTSRTW